MLNVSDLIVEQTIADLERLLPLEGVGLWSGTAQDVQHWLPLCNVATDPHIGYLVDPQEWLDALAMTKAQGLVPLALVHSHPTAEAAPSIRDRLEWMYPELWCVIVSFQNDRPHWEAYLMQRQTNRTAPC
ncbi:hypothetical protein CIG75_08140 [Tumebacillus algifaecis]|uniref:JAB domain-containing protein n=1 Tax=Tumebacillus algifaecis TaxID=1214604 RepID=A0A223D0S3_9BACL|nr:M67 family metallopeptidase [Tumebacillus algifaecis]ASS74957.1 hypothetical protein CIG75_08140 [Tumebacillus algifaecis]